MPSVSRPKPRPRRVADRQLRAITAAFGHQLVDDNDLTALRGRPLRSLTLFGRDIAPGQVTHQTTSLSLPVATSKTKPRTGSVCGTNGLALIRAIDWRTSSSRSVNASAAQAA